MVRRRQARIHRGALALLQPDVPLASRADPLVCQELDGYRLEVRICDVRCARPHFVRSDDGRRKACPTSDTDKSKVRRERGACDVPREWAPRSRTWRKMAQAIRISEEANFGESELSSEGPPKWDPHRNANPSRLCFSNKQAMSASAWGICDRSSPNQGNGQRLNLESCQVRTPHPTQNHQRGNDQMSTTHLQRCGIDSAIDISHVSGACVQVFALLNHL